jgi:hypothetical protein
VKPRDINTTIKRGEKEGRGVEKSWSEINSFMRADSQSLKRGDNQNSVGHFLQTRDKLKHF